MEKITIIIPVYNSEPFIEELIDRLEMLENVKLIFLDDGSTDRTMDLIKKIKKIPFKLIENNHIGPGRARNLGIGLVDTEYLTFFDSDDLIDCSKFQNIINSLNKLADYDIISYSEDCISQLLTIDDQKALLQNVLMINPSHRYIPAPYSKVFRTEFLKAKKIQFSEDVTVGEDMLFNVSAVSAARKIKIESSTFYFYRQNLNSITHSNNYDVYENRYLFTEQLYKRLAKLPPRIAIDIFQQKLVFMWLDDSFIELSRNSEQQVLTDLKAFFLPKIKKMTFFSKELSFRQKIFEGLLVFNMFKLAQIIVRKKMKAVKKTEFISI